MFTKSVMYKNKSAAMLLAALVCAGPAYAGDDDQTAPTPPVAPAVPATPAVVPDQPFGSRIVIDAIEPDSKRVKKDATWLGVGVEELDDALTSQLGLKNGEGLKVSMIAPESPAKKAEFHKNDVLVEFDDQMLVHPMQLRKLVQMHAEGDPVKITFYRGGKKQTIEVKLGKTTLDEASDADSVLMPDNLQNLDIQLRGLDGKLKGLDGKLKGLNTEFSVDRAKMNTEIRRTMEQTRRAIESAVRSSGIDRHSMSNLEHELSALSHGVGDVGKDATVIVRNQSNSTIVQTDDDGSYVIEAGDKTHLTARDKHGKLLYEGYIDTPEQRDAVPKSVWKIVEPMLENVRKSNAESSSGSSSASGSGSSFSTTIIEDKSANQSKP